MCAMKGEENEKLVYTAVRTLLLFFPSNVRETVTISVACFSHRPLAKSKWERRTNQTNVIHLPVEQLCRRMMKVLVHVSLQQCDIESSPTGFVSMHSDRNRGQTQATSVSRLRRVNLTRVQQEFCPPLPEQSLSVCPIRMI